jgi:ferredoxin
VTIDPGGYPVASGHTSPQCLDPVSGLQAVIDLLAADGYRVIGPVVRDGVIVYDDLGSQADMPSGHTAEQAPGRWRMEQGDHALRFSWTPGADSWKRFVFPARHDVLRVRRTDGSWVATTPPKPERPLALLGARDCEISALDILDRVLLAPDHPDARYADRREGAFIVAVTCGQPAATCWCTSMGGGPAPRQGFDLVLTELTSPHRLVVEAGSDRGHAVLSRLPSLEATDTDLGAARRVAEHAVHMMPTRLPGSELPALLAGTDEHSHWEVVAERCLSCGNCTLVCPTCFCSSFTDHTALDTDEAVRRQSWASCFELEHSYLAGRAVRATTAARYRQWLSHKLHTWPEQFGSLGCVGCGRCTTWCPAGIDLVEEAKALMEATP